MKTADLSAPSALARLIEGNRRFVSGVRSIASLGSPDARAALIDGQRPFAIVLSCSDSRVPSEIVYDCGLGELFIVRVAGNVVAPSIVGSVEFAAATFGSPLVVVMGHSRCGAVAATMEASAGRGGALSENIRDIVQRITPSVRAAESGGRPPTQDDVTRMNVRLAVDHLRHGSPVLEALGAQERLSVVGAVYALETGVVDFFDVPDVLSPVIKGLP
jgi:carbonic anhydrase